MTNHEILEKAKELFPNLFEEDYIWFPHGKNSVRVIRSGKRKEIVFTYYSESRWSLETSDNYKKSKVKKQKGE